MKFSLLLISSIFFLQNNFAQQLLEEKSFDTIAVMNGKSITSADFITRFELMPFQGSDKSGNRTDQKNEILYSLIAEKLFSLEGYKQNVLIDSLLKSKEEFLIKTFLRDILYKTLVSKTISISQEEYLLKYKKYSEQLTLQVLAFYDLKDAELFLKKNKKYKNISSAISIYKDSLFVIADTIIATAGSLQNDWDEAAFGINENQFTTPLKIPKGGIAILRILKRELHPKLTTLNLTERKKWIENQIKSIKEDNLAKETFYNLLKNENGKSDSLLFEKLVETIYNIAQSIKGNKDKIIFGDNEYKSLRIELKDYLNKNIISHTKNTITLNWAIEYLQAERLEFKDSSKQQMALQINSVLKTITQNDILSSIASQKELQSSIEFKNDVSLWMDNYTYHFIHQNILDTISTSEKEIADYILTNKNSLKNIPISIKVYEVFVKNDDDLITALKMIAEEVDFNEIAKKFHRDDFKIGKSGLFHISKYPEIGVYSLLKNINEIIGPIKINQGYSIFKITDKIDSSKYDFQNQIQSIKNQIKQEKINSYINKLAENYSLKIYEDKLKKINVSNLQMFTVRQIGFGGRILAAPMVSPQFEWGKKFKENKKINP